MTSSYHVYVTGSNVRARRQTGLLKWRRVEEIGSWCWSPEMPMSLDLVRLATEKQGGAALHVHVGAALCKLLTLHLPSQVHRDDEIKRVAQAQMHDQLGLVPAEWEVAIDTLTAQHAVACAIRRSTMDAIRASAKKSGLKLTSVRPFAAGLWNTVQEQNTKASSASVLMAIEDDAYSLFVARENRLESASTMFHCGEFDFIEREMQRLSLSYGEIGDDAALFAVASQHVPLLGTYSGHCLPKERYAAQGLYADFRDVLFVSSASV